MNRKLSLLLAAVMALSLQAAMAQDDAPDMDDDDDIAVEEYRDYGHYGWRRGDRWERDDRRGPKHDRRGGPKMRDNMGRGMHGGMGMGPGMGRGMHMGGMLGPRFMDMLQLDASQKGKIVDIMTENYRQRLLARMEMHDAMAKLRDLDAAAKPDHDAIVAANQAMGAARGKMDVLGRKLQDELRGVLTPEQLKKMDEWDNDRPGPGRRDFDRPRDGKRPPRPAPGDKPAPRN